MVCRRRRPRVAEAPTRLRHGPRPSCRSCRLVSSFRRIPALGSGRAGVGAEAVAADAAPRDTGGDENAMEAGPGYRQPVLLDNKLAQCGWLKPARDVVANSTTLRAIEGPGGTPTTIAVGLNCRAQVGVGSLHPLQLTSQCALRFGVDQRTRLHVVEDDMTTPARRGHSDPASIRGVTESLECSGVTSSQNDYTGRLAS